MVDDGKIQGTPVASGSGLGKRLHWHRPQVIQLEGGDTEGKAGGSPVESSPNAGPS